MAPLWPGSAGLGPQLEAPRALGEFWLAEIPVAGW